MVPIAVMVRLQEAEDKIALLEARLSATIETLAEVKAASVLQTSPVVAKALQDSVRGFIPRRGRPKKEAVTNG